MSATELGVWLAVIISALAIGKDVVSFGRKWRSGKQALDEALDVQPEIRKQLELGNVGAAVEHLNSIIVSQARALDRCSAREEALEAEIAGWEKRDRLREEEAARDRLAALHAKAEAERLQREVNDLRDRLGRLEDRQPRQRG